MWEMSLWQGEKEGNLYFPRRNGKSTVTMVMLLRSIGLTDDEIAALYERAEKEVYGVENETD